MALGIFCLAFFWKLPYLGIRDLCMDEPFTLFHSQKSVGEILSLSANGEPNPQLFMILVHYWNMIVGYNEEYLRILPLFFNALTASVLYLIGKRFFSFWAGVLTTGLFLFSNYYFFYATELRPYGLFSLATAGALYYFLRNEESVTTKSLIGLLICNLVLIYNHYFGWFVVGVEVISVLFYFRNKIFLTRILGVVLLTFICFLPMLGIVIEEFVHSSKGTWVEPPAPGHFKIVLRKLVNSGMVYRVLEFSIPIALILAFLMGKLLETPKKYLVVLIWWLIPFSVMFLISERIPMFVDRYILFNSIGLFVFIAAFVQRFAHFWWLQMVFTGVLIFHMATRFNGEFYMRREIAEAVKEVSKYQSENNIVIIHPKWAKWNFAYHYDLESFKCVETFDEQLIEKGIYSVWTKEEAVSLVDELGANEIIFFSKSGRENSEILNRFKKDHTLIFTKKFPNNIFVSKFRN